MGLINITEIQNDTYIDAEDVNGPLNAIVDVINGNLEAVNIKDGTLTTPKFANDSVTGDKIASLYAEIQENTTDVTKNDLIIQAGWGSVTPSGSSPSVNEAVTFPTPFSTVYSVHVTPHVKTNGSSGIGQFTAGVTTVGHAEDITTTTFLANLTHYTGANLQAVAHGYSWFAIGSKA